jgi:hypothetical protein
VEAEGMETMNSALKKSAKGYLITEEMLDVDISCWALITLLWKLDVLKYDSSINDEFDSHRYGHQRGLVEIWLNLYNRTH